MRLVQAMPTAIREASKCWVKRLLIGFVVENAMISKFLTFSEGRYTRQSSGNGIVRRKQRCGRIVS